MISVRNTILSVKHKPLSLTQLPIHYKHEMKRENEMVVFKLSKTCALLIMNTTIKKPLWKKTQMKAQRNEKLHDYLVWFFLQFCMDNNYSASSKTTLLNYYKQATTNSWLNQNNTAGRRVKEEEFLTQFGLLNLKKKNLAKKLLCMEKKTTMKKRATKSGLISEWRISQKWKIIQDASTSRKLLFDCFWFWFWLLCSWSSES